MVAFTFLWAETLLGAVPIWQEPQLCEVERTAMLPVDGGAVVLLVLVLVLVFVDVFVEVVVEGAWQVVQTVLAFTKVCEAGSAPTTQDPHEGIASALLVKTMGNANTDAIKTALIVFIDFMLPPNG